MQLPNNIEFSYSLAIVWIAISLQHCTTSWANFHLHEQCSCWPIRYRWLIIRINIKTAVEPPSCPITYCTVTTPSIIVIIICGESSIDSWFIACCKIVTTYSSISCNCQAILFNGTSYVELN